MTATPAPALLALLGQLDRAFPNRSRVSDGIMGDDAHKARHSDHNTGDALDVTRDEENGPDLAVLRDSLLADERVTYVILDRQIGNRSIEDGRLRPYDGPDPHTHHLHVSIRSEAREDTTRWHLEAASPWEQTS